MDGTSPLTPDRDRPFDPSKIAAGDTAADLVDAFMRLVDGMESRQRARKAVDEARHVAMTSALVLDLAHLTLTKPGQWLAVSLQKEFYSSERRPADFLTENFIALVKLLAGDPAVLELRRGTQGNAIERGRRTTIRPGSLLLKLIADADISLADIGRNRALLSDCLVLKSCKVRGKSSYLIMPDNELTRALRAEVDAINGWIASADIWWAGDEQEDGVDPGDRHLRRVFNNGSFEDGGRLFGGFWQPEKERVDYVCFGEHQAVGLDFGQMGVRSAYVMANAEAPAGDLYSIPGLERYRKGVKTVLSALLAADRIPKSFPKGVRKGKLFPSTWKFQHVYEPIAAYHSQIKHLFGTSLCHRQMYEESCLLIEILLRLKELGVVALPVHDGLVVSQEHLQIAEVTMRTVFRERLGIEGVVDVSFPTTTITFSPTTPMGTPTVFPKEGGLSQ